MKRFIATALFLMCLISVSSPQDTIPVIKIGKPKSAGGIRFSLNGGMSFLLASSKEAEAGMTNMGLTSAQAKKYYRNLRSGEGGNADLEYLITPAYGIGLRYKFFNTYSATEGFVDPQDGLYIYYGSFSEKIMVNFYGASILYRNLLGSEKFGLNAVYAFGLATYRNEAEYVNTYSLLTGKGFAGDIGVQVEYFLTPKFSFSADLSVFYSSLGKMKVNDGTNSTVVDLGKENRENLSRLDLSLGITFYPWK